eukprot:gene20074-26791_t
MGIDKGFELWPALNEASEEDVRCWPELLNRVRAKYAEDKLCVEGDSEIVFHVGEHPSLPLDLRRFRRFSYIVSGCCGDAKTYICEVMRVAKDVFGGDRIHPWSDPPSDYGFEGET